MENGVMLQAFHWYSPEGGVHWNWLASHLNDFKNAGITALWLPPPAKCVDPAINVGYGPYDLYDLGDYNQKGQLATKYGTGRELRTLCDQAALAGIQVYIDGVFNHKGGADETERIDAIVVAMDNRLREIGDWLKIDAWTKFNFTERLSTAEGKARSTKTWSAVDFDAVDFAENLKEWGTTIFKIKNKQFETAVSWEFGNYDYLCFADLDMDRREVKEDMKHWGVWVLDELKAGGFRLDAVKHVRSFFFREFAEHINAQRPGKFFVGEYWSSENTHDLHQFITDTGGKVHLFDIPLQTRFHRASQAWPRSSFDLRSLISGTLSAEQPALAVTFVQNHDTQPCQKLEQCVEPWFVPWAYAFILLREQGYPCIFLPDLTGADYTDNGRYVVLYSHEWVIRRLLAARHHCAWGPQTDYFNHPNTVGWTRGGNSQHAGLAVLINNGSQAGWKWMDAGRANSPFVDILEHRDEVIWTDANGWACFTVEAESCSVWVPQDAVQWIHSNA